MSITRWIAGLAFILILATTAVGRTDLSITVLLKSGEKISGQSYEIDDEFKVFALFTDDKRKKMSFSDISAIYNESGNNIAAELLGKFYRPVSGMRQSSSGKVYKRSRQKSWNTRIGFSGNLDFPSGDYYEGFKSEGGFGGNVVIALTHELGIRVTVTKLGIKVEQNAFLFYSLDPAYSVVKQDYSIQAISYMLALEYYRSVRGTRPGSQYFYAIMGFGIINHTFKLDLTVRENSSGMTASENIKSSESNFALNFGLGYINFITDIIGFESKASVGLVYATGVLLDGGGTYAVGGTILDFSLGIVFLLGKNRELKE